MYVGSTIALADGDAVRRAVPVEAQLRLPGKVAHVAHAVVLEAFHKVARMHIRDDERVDLPSEAGIWNELAMIGSKVRLKIMGVSQMQNISKSNAELSAVHMSMPCSQAPLNSRHMHKGMRGLVTLRRASSSSGERTSAVRSANCAFSFAPLSCDHCMH